MAYAIGTLWLFVLGGCATAASVARTRAANDLECREDQIRLTELGGTSFRATGCDRSQVYDCSGSSLGANSRCGVAATDYVCFPEGSKRPGAAEARSGSETVASDNSGPTSDGLNFCVKAFHTVGDLTAAWGEWHPDREAKGPPTRDEFFSVCQELSAKQQKCLLLPYGRQYRPTCTKTFAALAPDVAARLDDLFLEP